ncbi:MAG: adenylyltransferase/cytidyltransferase family protein [candidate division WOR-3 bacterium]|nr:adenylyltransferase/cytidyltransferase family protein [candidate division WOR-3 bacterium]MCX7948313.1 adenylyltransferase/cytidyltransferase family protein [candidate division WOR-3 bacterium]MDW8151141.1 adenylyltransferase/cytidyltransferase family protein [candidate division WOR-3 bacterium]
MSKYRTLKEAKEIVEKLRKENKVIVFTNGVFDILHVGHIRLLKTAKSFGDFLILALNSDISVKKIKSEKRPVFSLEERIEILSSIEYVDIIISFDEETPYEVIKFLRPDILVKGGDYKIQDVVGRDLVKEVKIIPYLEGFSTTKIIEKIKSL